MKQLFTKEYFKITINWQLLLSILIALTAVGLAFFQYKANIYQKQIDTGENNITNTILSGINANFSYIQESISFVELHNFQLHKDLNNAQGIEKKILEKRSEIVEDYYQLAGLSDEIIMKKIDEILKNNTLTFNKKYDELIKLRYADGPLIQKNLFDKTYKTRGQLQDKLASYTILKHFFVGLVLIFALINSVLALYLPGGSNDSKEIANQSPNSDGN